MQVFLYYHAYHVGSARSGTAAHHQAAAKTDYGSADDAYGNRHFDGGEKVRQRTGNFDFEKDVSFGGTVGQQQLRHFHLGRL